jgi:ATP/maltotriose-dependent transcriptional regulator MalT
LNADGVASLWQRAGQWYESHALLPEAVELALRGQYYSHAAMLIERTAEEMLRRGELVTFKRWIEQLPVEYVREQPSLCLYQAWALLWSGSPFELINASSSR